MAGPAARSRTHDGVLGDAVTSPARRAAYERAGQWNDDTLAGRVAAWATSAPSAVAVVDGRDRYAVGRLWDDARRLGTSLASAGVGPGSVVSVQLPNRYEAVVIAVAVQASGAVINPLLPNYRARELTDVFERARPTVIVTPAEYRGFDHRSLVHEVREATGVPVRHLVVDDGAGGGDALFTDALAEPPAAFDAVAADAVSELIFTSGTEASPKAIMHTEQTVAFSLRTAYTHLGLGRDDVVWMPSPVGHSTGFNYGLRFALFHRLPLVLQDVWDADHAAALVARERCTYTLAATTFLQDLVHAADRTHLRLDSLRYFGCGGSPVPPDLVVGAAERGIRVLRLYGSTEVLVGTWNRPTSPAEQRAHSDGVAMTGVELEVRDDAGAPCAVGEPGELFVRGPNTCVGFFADPDRTAATFDHDGWVRSGDVLTMDADGYVTVVGRKKEILIRGGMNIAPREIEELLTALPEVERAAVIGLPDERLGERACACVVLEPDAQLDLDTVVARLRATGLATYKLPERLEVVDVLPTTASGKVQKHELVRRFASEDGS